MSNGDARIHSIVNCAAPQCLNHSYFVVASHPARHEQKKLVPVATTGCMFQRGCSAVLLRSVFVERGKMNKKRSAVRKPAPHMSKRNDNRNAIAKRLRLTRIAYGRVQGRDKDISQTDFCDLVGLPLRLWNNGERASSRLGLDSAIQVAERIGVGLDWIYLGCKDGLPFKLAIEISKLEKELEKEGREPNRNWIDLGDGPSPSEN